MVPDVLRCEISEALHFSSLSIVLIRYGKAQSFLTANGDEPDPIIWFAIFLGDPAQFSSCLMHLDRLRLINRPGRHAELPDPLLVIPDPGAVFHVKPLLLIGHIFEHWRKILFVAHDDIAVVEVVVGSVLLGKRDCAEALEVLQVVASLNGRVNLIVPALALFQAEIEVLSQARLKIIDAHIALALQRQEGSRELFRLIPFHIYLIINKSPVWRFEVANSKIHQFKVIRIGHTI